MNLIHIWAYQKEGLTMRHFNLLSNGKILLASDCPHPLPFCPHPHPHSTCTYRYWLPEHLDRYFPFLYIFNLMLDFINVNFF